VKEKVKEKNEFVDSKSQAIEDDTLDLVCKDEKEFQLWAETLVAIHDGYVDQTLIDAVNQLPSLTTATKSNDVSDSLHSRQQSSGAALNLQSEQDDSNDVYMFGWSEWGQSGTGADVHSVKSPKLLDV